MLPKRHSQVVVKGTNKRRNQMAQKQGAGLWQYKAAVLGTDDVTLYVERVAPHPLP